MLDQFYSYLSERILEFFKDNPLNSGAKYNIQFETEEQVRNLYNVLKDNTLSETYEYKDENGNVKYKSYKLNFHNGKELIVAATIDNVQPDFLTRLRNMVGHETGYENKGILFIHNTTLDSIVGGTESFSKEGMPFHVNYIQNNIKEKISNNNFSKVDKVIVEKDLERKKSSLFQDSNSIFEYREILEIINKGYIDKNEYRNFGLFYDSKLGELSGKELEKKINENALYFGRVDEIHNYGNPETQLEKYFDDKGIDKLKEANWKDVEYKYVIKSVEDKKQIKPLEYIGASVEWDKEEGTSKAKSRTRNIIVFNENNLEEINLEFTFDDKLKKEYIHEKGIIGDLKATTSGRKLNVTLKVDEFKSNFYKVVYKPEKMKFEFKIVVLNFNKKYLEAIKSKYTLVVKKNESYISINTNDSTIIFNEFESNKSEYELTSNNEQINILSDELVEVKIADNFNYENDEELIRFTAKIENDIVPFGIIGTSQVLEYATGMKVWKLKREKKADFKSIGDNKLEFGTREYLTRDEFRKNLALEKEIIEKEGFCFIETTEGLEKNEILLYSEVRETYYKILEYYKKSRRLPSLTYLNDDLKSIYKDFIIVYLEALNSINEGEYLNKEQKNLFKLGVIKREIEDKELIFTPLHPLNIAYQLKINDELGGEELSDEIIKRFTSTYLLPYIVGEENELYIPMEQLHSPEWKYYVDEKLPRYKGSREFVSKLVTEKIEEFVGHFRYLFNMSENAAIRINLINTGDSKEILQGIFKYYTKRLKSGNNVLPIDLFIYSDENITNAFEEVAFNENIASIKGLYGIDLKVDNMSEEDVLNLYREKVQFYTKKVEDGIEYAHITFLEMSEDVRTITSKMSDIPSGVILNGEISGIPSVFLGDAYRTGFGTKYANTDTNLMNVAMKLNALNTASNGEPFNSDQCKAISVPNKSKSSLDDIYNASHWVTFTNPKVDLNFFKNDPDAKDLLIIHYSDQYTTAGGYDAITVTRKSTPYQRVIEEFLNKNEIENSEEYSPMIINMFNAINGDWLLRLLSSKSHFPKEKISILSAIKLALAKFKNENIIWVPISLEEILRVSGGGGLKQSEGFFSVKNLDFDNKGATSDDLLLVGIEEKDEKVFIHYYPIEVKIGINDDGYIEKGITQAKKTKSLLKETLLPKEGETLSNKKKVYRNFLMQLVVSSAEKLNLYRVCNNQNWEKVIDSELRRKLLNEDYQIVDSMDKVLGQAAVVSFKRGVTKNISEITEDVMVIEMAEEDGIQFITKTVSEIEGLISKVDFSEVENIEYMPEKSVEIKETIENTYEDVVIRNGVYKENTTGELFEIRENILDDYKEIPGNLNSKVEESRNMEIIFGTNEKNNKKIILYPNDTNKVLHTNTGIIGTMGTGKTQFTKSVITQIHRESKNNVDGKEIGILIFDYKGDYNKSKEDFIETTGAKVFELYHLPFNPLSVVKGPNSKPMLPLHTANSLKETIAKGFRLGNKQETLLRELIMEAYEKRGIIKNKPDTWDKPAPTLKDVYDVYESREDLKKDDSLYSALSNLIDFEIFEPDPFETKSLFELIDGVAVIDLSGYDEGIQNLVVAITLDLFYSQMQAGGHSKIEGHLRQLNKIILVDEADNFLSKDFTALKKILKEGREFGVGTILSTQLLTHFSTDKNDYANYILNWVVHRVDDLSNRDVKKLFNAKSKQEEDKLVTTIKGLAKHHSLVKIGDSERPSFMKDLAFWELI
ncbi:DNA phosphorothioation-dependent restriction protein DptH [Clostridium perfringens]|uniref:DNA phosphorothioation-dependent restriction protein DptH n=1 Tax=Clostridium perfringens TaxID=1502 RepID=UPI0013E34ED1|nr:DNA phosphorothioation-dependent restriction protein DptH [Clostridium perfringens]EIF6288538.1 DNA phosphorothioation-dependent restriction protein DptH [Clostridium perfringens]MDM0693944.1 DNA phosphorothioation-dependent restriction protein DptH [Clostridium perfringens]MDM0778834.1 DNA phosphorothioation-dependent restriction protein DptH [Clostridium perfringens]MDU3645926.1 DNA phosphorothioation-dependent restriction protein DptH [Clostridium perfringens]NGT05534.1 DNA phosphorothio